MSWNDHVFPHGPLVELAPRLWQVTGRLARGNMPRNMIVYRMRDGRLLVHSVIALDEAGMRALEQLGEPGVMIVPNSFHRLDAAVWRERFPRMLVACPAGARTKVEQKVKVDATCEEALPPLGVAFHAPPGLKPGELCYELDVAREGETAPARALIFTDMLFNLPTLGGFDGWLFKTLGSTGFFGMTKIGRLFMLANRQAFKGWLGEQAKRKDVRAISVAHGDAITNGCAAALSAAAQRL